MTGYELILSLSYPILIQLLIISYLYHILCTKQALKEKVERNSENCKRSLKIGVVKKKRKTSYE
jgi:hypothetical protein